MVTAAYFVADDSVEQESMFPVLGGALLLGQDLPIEAAPPADVTAGLGFFERASQTVGGTDPTDVIYELVERAFTMTPDVPMACASLGEFCLGVLYRPLPDWIRWWPGGVATATYELARDLTP